MTREQYIEYFRDLKEKYPNAKRINISYYGGGDSFDSFDFNDIDGEWNRDFDTSKYNDLLFAALDMSEANFNNEGSTGTIIINLENESITVDNYYREIQEVPTGEITLNMNNITSGVNQPDDQIIM